MLLHPHECDRLSVSLRVEEAIDDAERLRVVAYIGDLVIIDEGRFLALEIDCTFPLIERGEEGVGVEAW